VRALPGTRSGGLAQEGVEAVSYAEHTSVPVGRTKAEIESILSRYGATGFASGWEGAWATIMFKFVVARSGGDPKFRTERTVRLRFEVAMSGSAKYAELSEKQREQEERRIWRAALLVIKAKLESVESGIESFETAWLAHIVTPGCGTVGDQVIPRIAEAYATGKPMPLLLGDGR
jgi:hypothetical protein